MRRHSCTARIVRVVSALDDRNALVASLASQKKEVASPHQRAGLSALRRGDFVLASGSPADRPDCRTALRLLRSSKGEGHGD
jgi:hypothetical protein